MSEKLQEIINDYRSGLLSTPNIQVIEKKLFDETIKFPKPEEDKDNWLDGTFSFATFRNSDLIRIKICNTSMELSYFEQCLIQDCIFEHVTFKLAEMENCTFKNCQFIDCRLHKLQCEKTTFNKCKFLESSLDNAIFESCYFLKSSFEGMRGGRIGSAVLTDSKFSNFNTSIKFEGDVYFNDIFDQIDKLYIN